MNAQPAGRSQQHRHSWGLAASPRPAEPESAGPGWAEAPTLTGTGITVGRWPVFKQLCHRPLLFLLVPRGTWLPPTARPPEGLSGRWLSSSPSLSLFWVEPCPTPSFARGGASPQDLGTWLDAHTVLYREGRNEQRGPQGGPDPAGLCPHEERT